MTYKEISGYEGSFIKIVGEEDKIRYYMILRSLRRSEKLYKSKRGEIIMMNGKIILGGVVVLLCLIGGILLWQKFAEPTQ